MGIVIRFSFSLLSEDFGSAESRNKNSTKDCFHLLQVSATTSSSHQAHLGDHYQQRPCFAFLAMAYPLNVAWERPNGGGFEVDTIEMEDPQATLGAILRETQTAWTAALARSGCNGPSLCSLCEIVPLPQDTSEDDLAAAQEQLRNTRPPFESQRVMQLLEFENLMDIHFLALEPGNATPAQPCDSRRSSLPGALFYALYIPRISITELSLSRPAAVRQLKPHCIISDPDARQHLLFYRKPPREFQQRRQRNLSGLAKQASISTRVAADDQGSTQAAPTGILHLHLWTP